MVFLKNLQRIIGIGNKDKPKVSGKGWVVRIVIVLLAASLIPLAFSDFSAIRNNNKALIQVGSTAIPNGLISEVYKEVQQSGSKDPALLPILQQSFYFQVLELARNALFVNEANKLNLAADEEIMYATLAQSFTKEGKLDKEAFHSWIDNNYPRVRAYFVVLADQLKREQLTNYIFIDSKANFYNKILADSRTATRNVKYINVDYKTINFNKEVSDKELEDYLKANTNRYAKPEYRSASIIYLNQAKVPTSAVTESDITSYYTDNKALYTAPEKRKVLRFNFATSSEAKKAYDDLAKNPSSASKYTPIDLGSVEQTDLPNDMGKTAFTTALNKYSEPIQTSFGFDILFVSKIIPPALLPLASVRNEISKSLKQKKQDEFLNATIKKIEDEIFSGKSFEALAKEYNYLTLVEIPFIDKNQLQKATGKAYASLSPDILKDMFTQPAGYATQLKDDSAAKEKRMYAVKVSKIEPAYTPKVSDIKQELKSDYIDGQKKQLAYSKAKEIYDNLLSKKATLESYSPKVANINRLKPNNIFTPDLTMSIFMKPLNVFVFGESVSGYTIAIADSVNSGGSNGKDNSVNLSVDITQEYIKFLEKDYPIKINQEAMARQFSFGSGKQ